MSLDEFIATKSGEGWQIVNRTDSAVQMKRPKRLNTAGLFISLALVLVYGFGLLLLILILLDYLMQRDKVGYVTAADVESGSIPKEFREAKTAWDAIFWALLAAAVGVAIIGGIIWGLTAL